LTIHKSCFIIVCMITKEKHWTRCSWSNNDVEARPTETVAFRSLTLQRKIFRNIKGREILNELELKVFSLEIHFIKLGFSPRIATIKISDALLIPIKLVERLLSSITTIFFYREYRNLPTIQPLNYHKLNIKT
jgi:hypothetical protein